jgi:glycosyltransferase involved in cell wall biosynthesis
MDNIRAHENIDFSLVVPCYKEGPTLEDSVSQVFEILDETRWTYELIFVDDCSHDGTQEAIDRIVERYEDKNCLKIFHEKNKGRGGSVTDGIRASRGRIVGFIDIDLEVHARYIISMAIAIKNGADVASANRIYKLHPSLLHRHILSRGYIWLRNLFLGVRLGDTEAGCKFFDRKKLLPVLDECEDQGWFWDTEVMVRAHLNGLKIVEIPCLFIRRLDKKSTVRVFPDTIDYFRKLWKFRRTVNKVCR